MSDPLSITASVIAILQLAATATEYLRGIKNGAADRVKLRDELRSTAYLLEMLRDRIEDAEDAKAMLDTQKPMSIESLAGPDNPLILFQRIVEDIIAQICPQHKMGQRSLILTWPFTKKDVAEKLACLERLKSHFSLVMQNDLLKITQSSHQIAQLSHSKLIDMEQKVDDANVRHQEDQNQTVLLWLSTLQFREQQVAILESLEPGTGEWFIRHETVQSWLDGKVSLLWCPGLPGAGKTRLMSLVVDTLENSLVSKNTLQVYIYCTYNHRKEQTATALLSSLAMQVLQNSTSETIPPQLLSLYNSHKKYGTRPTSKELIELLGKITAEYETVFVVIDALDECTESEDEALRFLSTVRSIGPNIRIMCSSRFSTAFETYFASTKKVEVFARDEDIMMFLNSEIRRQQRLSKHVRADPGLGKEIVTCITEECQGMFLLAKLHLESLYTKITRKAVRLALSTLPTSLDDTYSETLQRIYSQPADTVELAEIVLFWVVCARENLTVTQLQHMYAMQELEDGMPLEDDDLPDGEILTGACGGLISVDSESQTIQVIHYTVQQYFEASLGPKLMTARLSLAKVSLAYLGLSNFSSGFCSTDAAMLRRLKEYPFIEYAAKHWGSDMGLLDTDQLWPDVKRLLSDLSMIEMISQAWSISNARYPNWSQEFPRNSPGLVLAAAFDLPDMLREMVANGHDIEASGTDRETAVIRAAAFGHTENVRVLIQLGAAVNAEDYMSETALLKAARKGHAGVIQELIDGGADVNNKLSNHWTPLMSAVSSGNLETVRMLAEAGAELMAETKWGDSALSVALRSGQENIALFLADSGAILPRGVAGRRAPIIASQRGFEGLVRRLTIDYRAIAERPLQRQSPRIMSGVAETMEQTTLEGPSDSQTEAQTIGEVSFGELMEQYDIKTNFHRRYTVLEQIGKGHFATVYLCRSRVTGVTYAVKIFGGRGTRLVSSDFEGLRSEIEVLRELQRHHHPNLMRMVDIFAEFETSGVHLVLELAPRGELFNFIVDQSKLTETETRVIFTQLFSAVQFLHSHGWVHRDIKPENILLLDNNLRIRLSDFGLAKKIRSGSRSDELTATLCGTPSYVAPEVLEEAHKREYTFAVDVWSCGVVLYICLCGFPPFSDELHSDEFPYTLSQQIKMGRFDYPSPYWDFVGDPALDLIDNMLVVDAVKRFSPLECLTHPWMLVKPWSELLNDAARSFQSPGLRHDAGINISSANEHSAVETTREAIESEGGLRDMSPVEWKAFYLAFDDQRIQKANSNRSTPLHLALEDDRLDLVDWLLEKGADIEAPDSCGTTPLGEACSRDRVKLLELLIAKGLSSSSLQFSGLSLLHWAFEADPRLLSHKEIVQLLLKDERTDVEAQDNNLRTPLIIAAARGYIEAVQLLLEHGALPNAKDRYHSTPLIAAVRNGHKAVVQHFLEIDGIEVDFGRTLNQTLFLWAKQSGSAEVVELLQRYAKKVGIKISESEQNMECSPDTWGFASRYCDICYRFISSGPYYRCEICAGGDFDICLKCSEGDFQCQDSSHSWVLSQ